MIRNIVFDVGKVLVSYEPDQMMDCLGFDQKTKDAVNKAMYATELWNECDKGTYSTEEFIDLFVANAPEYEKQIREAFVHTPDAIELLPHAVDWILDMKAQGYHVYILSNYGEYNFEKTKEKMKFLPLMDGAVFSYQCKMIKPNEDIYLHILDEYWLEPEETIFIDDRIENVETARKLGIHGVVFENYEQASAELKKICEE